MILEDDQEPIGIGGTGRDLLKELCSPYPGGGASLTTYYEMIETRVRIGIDSLGRRRLEHTNEQQWIDYWIRRYALKPIMLLPHDPIVDPYFEPVRTTDDTGRVMFRDEARTNIYLSVEENDQLAQLLGMSATGSRWSQTERPSWIWQVSEGKILVTVPADSVTYVRLCLDEARELIMQINVDIQRGNVQLEQLVETLIPQRFAKVGAHKERVSEILNYFGAKLRPSPEMIQRLEFLPSVKRSIEQLRYPVPRDQREPSLNKQSFETILAMIDAMGLTFERTPNTMHNLQEEDIRNLILASLNAAFDSDAVGEAFSNQGKTDIRMRVSTGGIFIAEAKIWGGGMEVEEAINQIRGYLTWRDAYGVVLIFSRKSRFETIRRNLRQAITSSESIVGEIEDIDIHRWSARHSRKSDPDSTVEIHYLLYNVHSAKHDLEDGEDDDTVNIDSDTQQAV